VLLGYFGERLEEDCGNCDICLQPPEHYDATEDAQKALSCVYRVGQRFGAGHVIDVLRGAQTQRVRQFGHDRLSTYGIGGHRSKEEWGSLLHQLIHRGYLLQDVGNYSVLRLTAAARPLLRGEQTLSLARPRVRVRVAPAKKTPAGAAASQSCDPALFEALRRLRKEIADRDGVPPFVVFTDATLVEMAALRPGDEGALLEITGVGQRKLERYGAAFLEVLRSL
jgi:ATP-dependent DNA helicase RecQ